MSNANKNVQRFREALLSGKYVPSTSILRRDTTPEEIEKQRKQL